MAKDINKIIMNSVLVTLIIAITGATTWTVDQMLESGEWYYCEQENNFKQCSELTKYGVENSSCKYINEEGVKKSDRCTYNREYYSWKPLTEYVNTTGQKKEIVIEAIQNCTDHFFNKTLDVWGNCSSGNSTYDCVINTTTIEQNSTICEKAGYEVNFTLTGKVYHIDYDCCQYYNDSPYEQFTGELISCKQKINNICNPLIQQSSPDPSVYDETGRIFVIDKSKITSHLVGGYQWWYDNDPYVGKVKEVSN